MRTELKIPPGIFTDDTNLASAGRWGDGSNVRFWENLPEVIGGWESLTADLLTGVCRAVFNWTDNSGVLNIGFGTHSKLEAFVGGGLYDVTPALALPSATLSGPFAVTDGSTTVTMTWPGHGLSTAETVIISGAQAVGRITPSGTYAVTKIDANTLTFTHGSAADPVKTLGSNPLTVTAGSPIVTVAETGHNIADGTVVTFSGATAVGGITPNGAFAITVIDANTYKYTFTSNASGGATGGGASVVATTPLTGGGSSVVVAPQRAFAAGSVDGTGGSGYSTGTFSTGNYSEPSTSDYFPRTWALGAWGANLMANWRSGPICLWTNATGTPAAAVANSPAQVTYGLVAPQDQLFALGCNEEVSGVFNPLCIRHSGIRRSTEWATLTPSDSTAREYILPGGGRIVAGRVIGRYILVWTTHGLFLGSYVGQIGQVWRFDAVPGAAGLIGPGAAVVVGAQAFWIGPDLQFYTYSLGGAASLVVCPIRKDFADNLATVQADKIVASSISKFGEVRWDYPDDRDGVENSRYIALSYVGQGWHKGQMARSAFCDAGPSLYPIGISPDGAAYWHEKGRSADGQAFAWSIRTADQYLALDSVVMLRGVWPDFKSQVGPVNITVTTQLKPQGEERTFGPYAMGVGEEKVDLRASGRLVRVEYSGNSAVTFMRLGVQSFDFVQTGRR